jgi:predicted nucleotide-binding protein (sugar kinase/HSP70/actin superfamily)
VDLTTDTKGPNGKPTREAAEAALGALPKPGAGGASGAPAAAGLAGAVVPRPVGAKSASSSPIDKEADLRSRTTYLPRMPYGGSRLLAAAFRSIGLDTAVTPESDSRTLELGGKYTSGDECYPQRIVLGDFMKLLEDDRLDPKKTAFLLPTANGPCRFGQYSALLRRILDDQGYDDVTMLSFTSADGYAGIGDQAGEVIRTAWRAVVVQDILLKLLLMTRPYEVTAGQTDKVYLEGLDLMDKIVGRPGLSNKERMAELKAGLRKVKAAFTAIPVRTEDRPLIGVVGEIFCRLNTFSNNELLRHIEAQGAECWLTGIGEWVLYTNNEAFRRLREEKRRFGKEWLKTYLTYRIMHKDEKALLEDFEAIFARRPEPHVDEVLERAHPYLPQAGSLGEMVLSTGGAIAYYHRGADGIVDISPFTCMNGIITEAVYPRVSKDHDHIPIRVFYFDGTHSDLDRDVGIFLELAKTYKRRKKIVPR